MNISKNIRKISWSIRFLKHVFTARNTKGFGIHSPYIFYVVRSILYEKHPYYVFLQIENQRNKLKKDHSTLSFEDFGTGNSHSKSISDIARSSLKRPKIAQLIFRLIKYSSPDFILELGTSLGVTTSYMASAAPQAQLISIEGSTAVANIAKKNLAEMNIHNVNVLNEKIDSILGEVVANVNTIDFAFFDANHKSEAITTYFEQCVEKTSEKSIFIIDDIHWSRDMEKGWEYIKNHKKVTSTIDIFECGIVFFNPDLSKQHYKIVI